MPTFSNLLFYIFAGGIFLTVIIVFVNHTREQMQENSQPGRGVSPFSEHETPEIKLTDHSSLTDPASLSFQDISDFNDS